MGKLKDISWKCLKCDSYKTGEKCYNCETKGTYQSVSNIMWATPILKNIMSIKMKIGYFFSDLAFRWNYINDYESKTMKHIFGISACGKDETNLYTTNDFDITYLKKEKKYIIGIETMIFFDNREDTRKYLNETMNAFTKWMKDNDYDTTKELDLYEIFTEGYNINSYFDSIEDAYATLRYLVEGF